MVRRDLAVAARVGQILLNAQELDFVPCSDFVAENMEGFSTQAATRLSFTDAARAIVARSRGDGLVLTFRRRISEDRRSSCASVVVVGSPGRLTERLET